MYMQGCHLSTMEAFTQGDMDIIRRLSHDLQYGSHGSDDDDQGIATVMPSDELLLYGNGGVWGSGGGTADLFSGCNKTLLDDGWPAVKYELPTPPRSPDRDSPVSSKKGGTVMAAAGQEVDLSFADSLIGAVLHNVDLDVNLDEITDFFERDNQLESLLDETEGYSSDDVDSVVNVAWSAVTVGVGAGDHNYNDITGIGGSSGELIDVSVPSEPFEEAAVKPESMELEQLAEAVVPDVFEVLNTGTPVPSAVAATTLEPFDDALELPLLASCGICGEDELSSSVCAVLSVPMVAAICVEDPIENLPYRKEVLHDCMWSGRCANERSRRRRYSNSSLMNGGWGKPDLMCGRSERSRLRHGSDTYARTDSRCSVDSEESCGSGFSEDSEVPCRLRTSSVYSSTSLLPMLASKFSAPVTTTTSKKERQQPAPALLELSAERCVNPATVFPYPLSEHSYHAPSSSCPGTTTRTIRGATPTTVAPSRDNLGVQTPSDSEEEIDVVTVGEKRQPLPQQKRPVAHNAGSATTQPQQNQYHTKATPNSGSGGRRRALPSHPTPAERKRLQQQVMATVINDNDGYCSSSSTSSSSSSSSACSSVSQSPVRRQNFKQYRRPTAPQIKRTLVTDVEDSYSSSNSNNKKRKVTATVNKAATTAKRKQRAPTKKGKQMKITNTTTGRRPNNRKLNAKASTMAATMTATPVTGRAGVRGGSDSEDLGRRKEHNDLERKRRNDLKSHFQVLRRQVPELENCDRAPKVMILNTATNYIESLIKDSVQLAREMAQERQRQVMLNQRLQVEVMEQVARRRARAQRDERRREQQQRRR